MSTIRQELPHVLELLTTNGFRDTAEFLKALELHLPHAPVPHWRSILKKYIAHVAQHEGVTFLEHWMPKADEMADHEWEALRRLDEECAREWVEQAERTKL